jgi:hypothetical protein
MQIQLPPRLPISPPIEYFRVLKDEIVQKTKEARQKMFEIEKGKTHYAIDSASEKGNYYINYKYPENCNSEDIISFKDELLEKGFEAEFKSDMYGDILKISWYPKE